MVTLCDIRTVLQLHSLVAAFSGVLALAYPPFFGAVFPRLAAGETLVCIARIYNVLVATQALLLYGLRKIESEACLRRAAGVYCLVFSLTACVAWHAAFVLHVTDGIFKWFFLPWLSLALPYGLLSMMGSPWQIRAFMRAHGVVAGSVGVCGFLFPETINQAVFSSPSESNYDTVSRYYGSLICGMSILTQVLTSRDAAAAQGIARTSYAGMFAVSAVVFFMAMYTGIANAPFVQDNWQSDLAGGFSVLCLVGMSFLYSTSSIPGETLHKE